MAGTAQDEGRIQVRFQADAHEDENQLRDLLPLFCFSEAGGRGYRGRYLQQVPETARALIWQPIHLSNGRMRPGTRSRAAPRSAPVANTVTRSGWQTD